MKVLKGRKNSENMSWAARVQSDSNYTGIENIIFLILDILCPSTLSAVHICREEEKDILPTPWIYLISSVNRDHIGLSPNQELN